MHFTAGIGRRKDDGVGFFIGIYLGSEGSGRFPKLVDALFVILGSIFFVHRN